MKRIQETLLVPRNVVKMVEQKLAENPRAFKDLKLNGEYIYFICDSIIQRMGSSIKNVSERIEKDEEFIDFYPLHSMILSSVCQTYKAHLQFMIDNDIIKCDDYWIEGEKSLGYRFKNKFISEIAEVKITKWTLKCGLRRRNSRWIEQRKADLKGHGYLTKWLENDKLSIDWERASKSIQRKKADLLTSTDPKKDSKIDFYSSLQYATAKRFEGGFTSKDFDFSGSGNRFYSPLTNMPKALRGCLLFDGQPLVGVDISNSQPYLLSILFRESFWANYYRGESKTKKTLKFKELSIRKEGKEEVEDINSNTIIKCIKTFETLYGSDLQNVDFFKLVFEGKLYEYLETKFKNFYPELNYNEYA